MTLGEFHELLSSTIGRGTSQASSIPGFTRRAARWIERNNTFQYMRRWLELDVDASSKKPHVISIYNYTIKRLDSIRYVGDDERFHDLKGPINPKDRTTRIAGVPSAYWLDGTENIVLDAIPDEDMEFELHAVMFTKWPTNEDVEHWLLSNAEDAMLGRAMMFAAFQNRDERLYNANKAMLMEALQTLSVAEHELVEGPNEVIQQWNPLWDQDQEP